MSTYYFHDGRNEVGPFSIDLLKKQKLTRNTPVRQDGSDSWLPAEKIPGLKEIVAPRKIKRPKDIVPVVIERVADFKQRRPKTLYACLFCIALLAGISIYSLKQGSTKENLKKDTVTNVGIEKEFDHPSATFAVAGIAPSDKSRKEEVKEDKEKETRLRWNKLISATNSNYGIGFFGGIKDLKIIVNNRSDYPIDEAIVNVTYIKASGGVWKVKPVAVYDIPSHENKEQSVPDVGRGKKVTVSIKKIVSRKMKFSYTSGKKIENPDDPNLMD